MKAFAGAVFALFALCGAARAEPPLDLYYAGKFEEAVAAGHAQNDAEGFATAARAELASETMRPARCLECIRRAEDDARKAISADPKLADGHVFLAVALGRESHLVGMITAASQGYASKAKKELDAALADNPSDAGALAALGGWNIAIVRNGGGMMARMIYGATITKGLGYFAKAFEIEPEKLTLRYQYALSLSDFDVETYRKPIEDALVRATEATPKGVYEAFVQKRAKALLETLRDDDLGKYSEMVSHDEGYPQ